MQPWEIVLTVGAVTGAFIVIFGAVYRIYKIAKRIDDALGLDRQGRTIADRLSRIEHQLFPNGGSSISDKINQIAFDQQTLRGEVDSLKEVVTILIGEKR